MIKKAQLDKLYRRYNKREYVSPDPLQFLCNYSKKEDREIVAMIASALAYGRVAQILKSVTIVLDHIGPAPRIFLDETSPTRLNKKFDTFKHRFTTGPELASLLIGMKNVLSEYGSLNECFKEGIKKSDPTILPALQHLVNKIACKSNHLLPSPDRGSACKRLNLFLRWMVRKDAVDPGGWTGVSAGKLLIPLDVHMARTSIMLGLTKRKSANIKMAEEVTTAFKIIQPNDPIKYDFVLTRFGIRNDMDDSELQSLSIS